jgi:catechol 2,3-dioxygenase-like lactoylglutathione lyase family enzyme
VVDHLWLRVRSVQASRDFYAAIAECTGFALVVDEPGLARFRGPSASFTVLEDGPPSANVHVAFPTDDDAVVRDFHAAALAAGAPDNGGPGERPEYHPGYYGAFVLDPDGHNIEAVCHTQE